MTNIYILELESNKFYIGKTNFLLNRLNNHFNDRESEWTKKYKPIKIVETIENCDNFDEDKYTKIYMSKYGIGNVRGGSYCQLTLSEEKINFLLDELNGSNDNCFNCGNYGHFIKECKINDSEDFEYINNVDKYSDNFINGIINNINNFFNINLKYPEFSFEVSEDTFCYICGRTGHYINNCYAKTHDNGYKLNC